MKYTTQISIIAAFTLWSPVIGAAQTFTEMGLQLVPGIEDLDCSCSGGRGASFADVDGDGWPDLTITSNVGDSLIFYRNDSGTFTRVYPNIGDIGQTKTLIWVDLDNDGDRDLVTSNYGQRNRIYRCDGPWTYTDVTASSGLLNILDNSTQVSAGDVNNDGLLDLFFANYQSTGYRDMFYVNNGGLNFTEVGLDWDLPNEFKLTFTGAFVDFNRDGWQDLYLIVDRYTMSNKLYQNINGQYFEDVSGGSGADISIDAMDAGIGDFNEDGWMDVYVSNTNPGNVLLKNLGNMQFSDYTDTAGVALHRTAWGANWMDIDNDMDLDLHASCQEGIPAEPNALYINQGPPLFNFQQTSVAGDTSSTFCELISDFNHDGYMDYFLVNNNFFRYQLFVNDATGGKNWVKIQLQGTQSNRDGVGAQIVAKVGSRSMHNYVNCGEAYLAQNDFIEHFGLGSNNKVDTLMVFWPSGIVDTLYNLDANQIHHVIENSSNNTEVVVDGSSNMYYDSPVINYQIFVSGDLTDTIETGQDSTFSFSVPEMSSFTLTPYKNDGWNNDLSIADLVEILNHLTQNDLLDSPWEHIAADADGSGTISITDLVYLLNILTGNIDQIPGNTSYRFIPSDYQFVDPQNPLLEDFPESTELLELTSPASVEFTAVKTGNVN